MPIKKTLNRRKVLAGTSAAVAATAVPMLGAKAGPIDAFYRTGEFTTCDVKMLSRYWGKSFYDAKVFAGQKIQSGYANLLRQAIKGAGRQGGVNCVYTDGDYNYNDAAQLAKYWSRSWGRNMTPWDAKLKIELNLKNGGNLWIRGELKKARRGS